MDNNYIWLPSTVNRQPSTVNRQPSTEIILKLFFHCINILSYSLIHNLANNDSFLW
ncbi:hypothetical protein [uncultured Brachyspira sp.]|uniref:hypothetical protein n=1 Tax=uncultured Brachyspira sp. TaxID=221953 RepID=UPI0032119ADB